MPRVRRRRRAKRVGGIDARPDAHRDRAGALEKRVARPEQARVVRHRHDRRAARRGEPRAAELIGTALARTHAGALRKYHDPEALLEPFTAAPRDGPQSRDAARAVDGDRAHQREAPAEERDPQELALEHMHLRRKDQLERQRLPRRLVLGENHRRARRQVLAPFDAPADAEQRGGEPDDQARPAGNDLVAQHARQRKRRQGEQRVRWRDQDERSREQRRAHPRHGASCSANAARSANTCVPGGRLPSALVFLPLPVSTSTGRAPAAAAACTSRSASPTM